MCLIKKNINLEIIKTNNEYFYKIPIDLLENYRLSNFLSVKEISNQIGISYKTYLRFFNETRKTNPKNAKLINKFLENINKTKI